MSALSWLRAFARSIPDRLSQACPYPIHLVSIPSAAAATEDETGSDIRPILASRADPDVAAAPARFEPESAARRIC